jgi:hypothetical protein
MVVNHGWLAPRGELRVAREALLDGTLGPRFGDRAGRPIEDASATGTEWIVVAYSAGGWMYYSWAESAAPSFKERIIASIVIGAPRRNLHRELQLGQDILDTVLWNGPDEGRVLSGFAPGAPFIVIASDADETVPMDNAIFDSASVVTRRVQGVPHDQLLDNVRVLEIILEELSRLT